MKKTRCRFKQTTTFRCRVEAFARDMRAQAQEEGVRAREDLLRRAWKADTAIDVDEWISGNKERPELLEVLFNQLSPGDADSGGARQTKEVE